MVRFYSPKKKSNFVVFPQNWGQLSQSRIFMHILLLRRIVDTKKCPLYHADVYDMKFSPSSLELSEKVLCLNWPPAVRLVIIMLIVLCNKAVNLCIYRFKA